MVVMTALLTMVMMTALLVMVMAAFLVMVVMLSAAGAHIPVVVFIVMMAVFFLHMLQHFLHHLTQRIRALDGLQNSFAVQQLQRRGDDCRLTIVLADQAYTFLQLPAIYLIGSAQKNCPCIFNLVQEKFPEILHIHLCLGSIHHCHCTVHLNVQLRRHILHGLQHIGQLAHSRRLNQDSLRCIGLYHFLQRSAKITHKRTADATGIHLFNLNTGLLQKTAVNTDLSKLVLNQHSPAAIHRFPQQFLNKRRLPRSQKTGKHIYFCHFVTSSSALADNNPIFLMECPAAIHPLSLIFYHTGALVKPARKKTALFRPHLSQNEA